MKVESLEILRCLKLTTDDGIVGEGFGPPGVNAVTSSFPDTPGWVPSRMRRQSGRIRENCRRPVILSSAVKAPLHPSS